MHMAHGTRNRIGKYAHKRHFRNVTELIIDLLAIVVIVIIVEMQFL